MEEKNIELLLDIFTKALESNKFSADNPNLMYISCFLKELQNKLPTFIELERAREIITDLEIKYEEFYEIANYFDPVYIKIKNILHKDEVKKIREENRRKRGKL